MLLEMGVKPVIKTRWVLREFMARYKISNVELGNVLGKHVTTIARLKRDDVMPQLKSSEIDELCNALTRLLERKNIEKEVTYSDLFQHESK